MSKKASKNVDQVSGDRGIHQPTPMGREFHGFYGTLVDPRASNPGHRYQVTATRLVGPPNGNYYHDSIRREFTFGKGKHFLKGEGALAAAQSFAEFLAHESSSVSIGKMNGNGGLVHYIKEDRSARFDLPWEKVL